MELGVNASQRNGKDDAIRIGACMEGIIKIIRINGHQSIGWTLGR